MRLTQHATRRMKQMCVEVDEVVEVMTAPSALDYPSPPSHPPGRRVRVAGRLAVVYEPRGETVISVLWNGEERR